MKTRQEIKDAVALEHGHANWLDMLKHNSTNYAGLNYMIDKVMRLNSEQALELAAYKVELTWDHDVKYDDLILPDYQKQSFGDGRDGDLLCWIDRDSILSLKDQLK